MSEIATNPEGAPQSIAHLCPDDAALLKSAHKRLVTVQRAAEKAALRIRVDLMDADDALGAVLDDLGARYGFDPTIPVVLHDDGTLTPSPKASS